MDGEVSVVDDSTERQVGEEVDENLEHLAVVFVLT